MSIQHVGHGAFLRLSACVKVRRLLIWSLEIKIFFYLFIDCSFFLYSSFFTAHVQKSLLVPHWTATWYMSFLGSRILVFSWPHSLAKSYRILASRYPTVLSWAPWLFLLLPQFSSSGGNKDDTTFPSWKCTTISWPLISPTDLLQYAQWRHLPASLLCISSDASLVTRLLRHVPGPGTVSLS